MQGFSEKKSVKMELSHPNLFSVNLFTDGGPDHRSTYWSVQLSYLAMFVALDLDLLVTTRTAPSQCYRVIITKQKDA